jgi:hypothetical protein
MLAALFATAVEAERLIIGPDGQFKLPRVWSVKLLHP